MYSPTQSRTLSVSCDAFPVELGKQTLFPVRLRGTEALGKLYRYTLDMATTYSPIISRIGTSRQITPEKLVGKEVTISIEFDGKGTFVTGIASYSGAANVGAGVRTISGIISKVELTGADDRHVYYRLVVRPTLWLTTKTSRSRIFQNRSVLDITSDVLRDYPILYDMKVSAFRLKNGYPERDFVRQMWESDFDFLTRLWREWGLYYFEDNNRLVFCDAPGVHRPHGNAYDSIRYHAPSAGRIDEEYIYRLNSSRRITAAKVSVVDYDYTRARQNLPEEHDAFGDLHRAEERHWGDYSQPLAGAMGLSGQPNSYLEEARYLAGVRAYALYSRNERLRGRGNLLGLKTGRTFRLTDHPEPAINAEYLVVSTTVDIFSVSETTVSAGMPDQRRYQCVTDFVLQPTDRFFKNGPKKKPRCHAETAVVVGPKDRTTWVDAYGRVKISYLWDLDRPKDENASCWVRVSSPWQGDSFGTIYVPRIGEEVTVNYHEGDPDKPYIADRMVNRFRQPPWKLPANHALSGTRTRDLDGLQANQIVADDTPGKLQVQVSSDYAQSRLVLGYNTHIDGNDGRKEERGQGWELATDSWGALRANRGMVISTETRAGATAPVKDMGETGQRLTQARELHEDMADVARQHNAQQDDTNQRDAIGDIKAQTSAIRGDAKADGNPFPELARPDMVLASAAGIGMTAAQSTHIASRYDLAVTTGRDVSIASGRSLFAAVRGAVSLFAYQLGMRLIAAKGKVEVQAQSDEMALTALKDVTITSTNGRVVVTAAKEVWIGAGGSYIQINGSGIINGSPGPILERTASWDVPGPDARIPSFAPFGSGTPTDGHTHSL
ncbi:type VI secretion system Vgr family protein [Paraburkholderia sediminicola]|uniref:type VI secretion system Vgr family protein n=1 Tax=Paraburkholderia sediminicola TaxID=458836 RepID=UPI0038B98A79